MSKANRKAPYPKTPELDRLKAVASDSQKIGLFIDSLGAMGITLCKTEDGRYWPLNKSIPDILAEYFEINTTKVEKERDKVLAWARENT